MLSVYEFDTVDSTNTVTRNWLNAPPPNLGPVFAILAHEQQAGRGSQGRVWHSEKGKGLYLSYGLSASACRRFGLDTLGSGLCWVTPATGLAVAKTLAELFGLQVQLKPVNDIYVKGRKLGGILVESTRHAETLQHMVIGIGLNFKPVNLPSSAGYHAISLQEIFATESELESETYKKPLPAIAWVQPLWEHLLAQMLFLVEQGPEALEKEYQQYLLTR